MLVIKAATIHQNGTYSRIVTTEGTRRMGHDAGHAATHKKSSETFVSKLFVRAWQLPTLPPGGAVPSAMVSLTSLFGMGRGGSSPL